MRAEKLRAVEAANPVATAQISLAAAEQELERATKTQKLATDLYDADDSEKNQTLTVKAHLALERAQRVHAARDLELKAAERARDEADRAAGVKELEREIVYVNDHPRRLEPHISALVALDTQASTHVDALLRELVQTDEAHDRIEQRAEQLQMRAHVQSKVRRPEFSFVVMLVRVAIALDRQRTNRDIANGWLSAIARPEFNDPARAEYDAALAVVESLNISSKEK